MILPSDKYGLLLLADWLEEFGSSYDIVKANAIRNFKYSLNYEDSCELGYGCGIGSGHGSGFGFTFRHGSGYGDGVGYGYGKGSGKGHGGVGLGIGIGYGSCKK